ncbi:MAG: TonB-dependent receptor [Dysgonomonas sp.]|nr:TonB-dependent receptor [Dysgonomonas sp.]
MKCKFKRRPMKGMLFLFLSILLHSGIYAQTTNNILIEGTVVDQQKEAVIGASVVVKGTINGTVTDIDGHFKLNAPSDAVLVISYIGFEIQEISVNGQNKLSITLLEDEKLLSEVVIIGYGQVKKGDITGSLTTFKPDELNKGKVVTAKDAMIGKIAGVSVTPGSGAPGDEGTIRIRMGASLSASNDPLLVIDGVPVEGTSISSINPADIESFTVLKDASATAIYGSRSSNGVIIITTKKGNDTKGKVNINYSSNYSISHVAKDLDVLDADTYREVFKQHANNVPVGYQLGNANTDWQKEIYRTAFGTDHNLSATGALLEVPYRLSFGYYNQNGVVKENNYERLNLGIGLSPKFFDKHLSFDINLKGSIENEKPVSSGIAASASTFDPTRPVHAEYPNNVGLGYFMWMDENGNPITKAGSNPVADLKLTDKFRKTKRSIGNLAANYKIHGLEDLILHANFGYDVQVKDYDESIPNFAPSMYVSHKQDGSGKSYYSKIEKRNYLIDLYANYKKEFLTDHTIDAMGGYGWQRFWYRNEDATYDSKGDVYGDPTFGEAELYLLSFYGRLNYSYAQKILLTATLRADASSRFAKDNRWGYFPSVALAYRMTEEAFLKDFKPLSDLKLRLSYGQTGQQDIGSYYQHLGTYTTSYDASRYQFGDEWLTLYRPNGYDPLIKWETTTTYNFGLDYGFLNNRISGSVDFYTRRTKNLLNFIAVPAGSNYTNKIDTNIGNMKNKGIEVAVTAIPVKTKDWEWSVNANFTWNASEITKLNTIDSDDNYIMAGNIGDRDYVQVHKVGYAPYTYFLMKQAYDDNGKPLDGQYVAPDGEIVTSVSDKYKYVSAKSPHMPYFYGLSTRLSYKSWDLGINAHGGLGNYIYNYQAARDSFDKLYSADGNTSGNIMKSTLKTEFTDARKFSDYFLEKGDFFKIDNITLGYSFPRLWNNKTSLRLAFNVQNVALITDYSGIDPEIYSGLDRNSYQRPRTYSFSLNLNF